MKRRSIGPTWSMCVQPAFIIGTRNEDGTDDFAPITWVSVACEGGSDHLPVVSMFGGKMTGQNVIRTGRFSADLVSRDMLPLMDYFGSCHAKDGRKDGIAYGVSRGEVVDVPVPDASRRVYECETVRSVENGESITFFAKIRNVQADEELAPRDLFDIDLTTPDPVVYSGMYHSIGELLGQIGDYLR